MGEQGIMSNGKDDLPNCFCCGMALSKKCCEYHHFPKSKANGGKSMNPLCMACHDYVDRIKLDSWFEGTATETFAGLMELQQTKFGRLFLMKMVSIANRVLLESQEVTHE